MVATESKKHHYVPRSVLKRFSIEGAGKQVYVFDKTNSRAWPSAILDAGSENQFNTVEVNGERVSFEDAFHDVDDRLAVLLDRLSTERSLANFRPTDRHDLADLTAVQIVRTKLARTSMLAVAEGFIQAVTDAGIDPATISNFSMPTDQATRLVARAMLAERDGLCEALATKRLVLVKASGERRFWTSDNPVAMFNTFPYGELGLSSPGIEIYYPFSPTLCLAFFCPSIELKIREALAQPSHALPSEMRARFAAIHNAMVTGEATTLAVDAVGFVNELQVRRSSRFLYATTDQVSFAKEILARDEGLRNIVGHTQVGRMGGGLPRKPNMPPGLWLVIYGRLNHHMLAIEEWDEQSRFIEVTTSDVGTLAMLLRDQPLQQATVFQDGAERRRMREIKIELIGRATPQPIRIIHNDDGLNALVADLRTLVRGLR
ncbi:DUF4238 domain-containing protein [Bradyrhizobium sp. CCBAU 51753]|uniref:DUF4238 domain-containing protein n=1 Tax=Bradyrhizobium sp. CCBAU 51753 TaxID=1325100 RepID=UPI00188A8C6D|nr:DUF4238 domain-containing protein [Bradyrhizobium sp. CCBAU 51753]QOZ28410.1 hypothetical protein XH93_36015 [Bradyrhizobium sp. CCBAU 51753]